MRLDQTSQWQCGTLNSPLELFAKSLWDPQVMKDFVLFSPEETYWLWIMCVQQEYISCLVLWSIQQLTSDWKWNALAWVFICWYRTLWWFFKYWPFDEELRASFATNYTKSDTRLSSIIWLLDVGVSTTWSWGEWSWKVVSIKSQVKWWSSFPVLPEIVPQMLWVFVFCLQGSWPALWSLGALYWFWLGACLLSSGYDHRWYRATQQAIYVASVEEMAYIGSTWVETVMWPVMMQTILILNVQERKRRRLAGLLGGQWQHQSRMEMSCHAYRLTTKGSSPQKVDLNQPLMIGAILFPRII